MYIRQSLPCHRTPGNFFFILPFKFFSQFQLLFRSYLLHRTKIFLPENSTIISCSFPLSTHLRKWICPFKTGFPWRRSCLWTVEEWLAHIQEAKFQTQPSATARSPFSLFKKGGLSELTIPKLFKTKDAVYIFICTSPILKDCTTQTQRIY